MVDKSLTKLFKNVFFKTKDNVCCIKNCRRSVYAKNYCSMHYQRLLLLAKRGVDKDKNSFVWYSYMNKPPRGLRKNEDGTWKNCDASNCEESVYALGLCHHHYIKKYEKNKKRRK